MSLLSLPSTVLLEVASAGDASTLARLLQTCKGLLSSAESDRAWKQIAGPRGALVDYSSRRLAVVNERVRALLPISLAEFQAAPAAPVATNRELSEFTFTWAFFWRDGEKFQSATFEHMTCSTCDHDPSSTPAIVHEDTDYVFQVPADATGHAALSPHLRRSQDHVTREPSGELELDSLFYESWPAHAMLICTRKRDGVTVELARFPALEGISTFWGGSYQQDSTCARFRFVEGYFECPGLGGFDVNANLVFERATGKLVNVYSGFWPDNEADQVSPVLLWTICHAKCDAVEATRLSN